MKLLKQLLSVFLSCGIAVIAVALLATGFGQLACAQPSKTKAFASADEAVQSLYEAAKTNDSPSIQAILGDAGYELVSSGNAVIDKIERQLFAEEFKEMHRLVREQDGSVVLYVGAASWQFPIPLIADGSEWRFDADADNGEIIARRIAEDEILAIEVCQALSKSRYPGDELALPEGPALEFARKLVANDPDASQPFYGYQFRIGSEQSVGVVLVAYPVGYGRTGTMTFIILPGGYIYKKDLGPETATIAPQINSKPNGEWFPVQTQNESRPASVTAQVPDAK